MRSLRFSLKTFLGIVTLLALDFGTIAADSMLASSMAYVLFLALFCFASAAAFLSQTQDKPFWTGFAVFACVYWLTAIGPHGLILDRSGATGGYANGAASPASPAQLADDLLAIVEDKLAATHAVGAHAFVRWRGGGYYWGTILQSQGGQYLIRWDDGSAPTWQTSQDIAGASTQRRAAMHLTVATLWALFGGASMSWFFARQQRRALFSPVSS